MKAFVALKPGSLSRASGFLLVFVLLMASSPVLARQNWAVNASLSFNSGQYIYQQRTNNYYLNTSLRYSGNDWFVSTSLPFILQSSAVYDLADETLFSDGHRRSDHSRNNFSGGVGDVYFYGEYRLVNPVLFLPSVSGNVQIKVPTSSQLTLFSSGEFDYGFGFILRKWFGSYNGFADMGYLYIGNPEEITYLNPLSYGLGLNKFFSGGQYSVSIYFKGYTEIIQGINPPRQLSLGLFSALSAKTILSFYLIKGFSESSPDFALSSGIDWKF